MTTIETSTIDLQLTGMGVELVDGKLTGIVRTTLVTGDKTTTSATASRQRTAASTAPHPDRRAQRPQRERRCHPLEEAPRRVRRRHSVSSGTSRTRTHRRTERSLAGNDESVEPAIWTAILRGIDATDSAICLERASTERWPRMRGETSACG